MPGNEAQKIKVRSIEFGDTAFRKLRGFSVDFSDRITLIAGHNGIGKSTILGLVANTFGLAESGDPQNYFGEQFYANVEKIVYLALSEVEGQRSEGPVVTAEVGAEKVRKRCAMTRRSEWKRARVVPRLVGGDPTGSVSQDGKIRLPTIYLGMRRLAPVGEADEGDVTSRRILMDAADQRLMFDFVVQVIHGISLTDNTTRQSIKGSKKRTVQPGYEGYESLAVSVGQDSLASIATALASFNRLSREQGADYPGGLLVVDELDAGFHPHAIDRLVGALKSYARRLNLQVIATTHSPRMIETLHPDGGGHAQADDSVVYLVDTRRPRRAEDQSLGAILDDMAMRIVDQEADKPTLFAHFEDEEAFQFFDMLFPGPKRGGLSRRLGIKMMLYPMGIGGSQLVVLPQKDPIFRNRLLVVDGDTKVPAVATASGNVIKLPRPKGAVGIDRSPENIIRLFLLEATKATNGPIYDAMLRFRTRNPTTDKVSATFFDTGAGKSGDRLKTKAWWITHWKLIKQWGVVERWAELHPQEVSVFLKSLETAITNIAARINPSMRTRGSL